MNHPDQTDDLSQSFSFKSVEAPAAVLLLHGFTGSPFDVRGLGSALRNYFTVFGPRLPGHATRPEELNLKRADDWLAGVIDAYNKLAEQYQNIIVIGYSFGGNLALEAAAQGQIKPLGLVTINTPIFFPREYLHRWIIPILKWFKANYPKHWLRSGNHEYYQARGKYTVLPLKALAEMYRLVVQNRQSIKRVSQPVLIIQAKGDRVVKPISAQYLHDKIGSSQKRLFWIAGAGHSPNPDKLQPVINQEIINFIKQLCQPK